MLFVQNWVDRQWNLLLLVPYTKSLRWLGLLVILTGLLVWVLWYWSCYQLLTEKEGLSFFSLEIRVLRWVMTRAVLESSSSSWWVVVYVRCIVRLKKLNTILLRWHPKFFCFTCWRKEWVLVLKEWFFWSWKERSDVYYEGGSSKMMWCCREGGPLAHD